MNLHCFFKKTLGDLCFIVFLVIPKAGHLFTQTFGNCSFLYKTSYYKVLHFTFVILLAICMDTYDNCANCIVISSFQYAFKA